MLGTHSPEYVLNDIILAWGSQLQVGSTLSSAALTANTALTGILVGTPVTPIAPAAGTWMLGNILASGDILLAVNKGGTSHMAFMADASTGDTIVQASSGQSFDVYIAGTKELDYNGATLALTGAHSITTSAGDLTIAPSGDFVVEHATGTVTFWVKRLITTAFTTFIQSLDGATTFGSLESGGIIRFMPGNAEAVRMGTSYLTIGTAAPGTGATFNLVFAGGVTTPVIGAVTADIVQLAGVDNAAGDRRLYIQAELGDPIRIGNNAVVISAIKVLGAQGAVVADASGGATIDAEARTAINALLARARAHGLIAT